MIVAGWKIGANPRGVAAHIETDEPLWVCPEDPTDLAGAPLGQYHCPWCGCMQIAGIPHLEHQEVCWLGLWSGQSDY